MAIISIAIFIGLLVLSFKITWFIFKACGKLLGLLLSIIGYIIIGSIGISLVGIAIIVIPFVIIVGGIAIISTISALI